MDAQRETDVEFGDADETTPCLAEVNDVAGDADGDDVSRAESVCGSEDSCGHCLSTSVHHDDAVNEMTPCLAADGEHYCPIRVSFTQPADSHKVFADYSQLKDTYIRHR